MKKFVSVLMALLFLLGICGPVAAEEEIPTFSGLVTDIAEGSITVFNAFGAKINFKVEDPAIAAPVVGSFVDVAYVGDIAAIPVASAITVVTPAVVKSISGTVETVESDKITVKPAKGSAITVSLLASTAVTGKAETYKVGDTVTVTYSECSQYMTIVNLATVIEVTKVKEEKKEEDTTNKKLTGVVTSILPDGDRFTIRTSKGKSWTFKIRSKTSFPSKKEFTVGCTVTVTYDGYASSKPYAKKVNVTKTAEETERGKIYKKSGTVEYFGGMMIGLTNGFEADLAYAKHTGKSKREAGRKVTIYYYKKNGENFATKVQWK